MQTIPRRVLTGLWGFVLIFGAGIYLLRDQQQWVHAWANAGWTLIGLLAAAKCFGTAGAQTEPARKRAWQLFGVGCASWFLGMLIWDYYELQGRLTPFPEISDIFFLALPPCFVAGFFVYGSAQLSTSLTLKRLADLGVVGSAMVMLCTMLYFKPVSESDESPLYLFAALAYPALHLSALCFALISIWHRRYGRRMRVLTLLVVAIAVLALVTTLYGHSLLVRTYEAGHVLDILWVISFVFVMFAAYEEDSLVEYKSAVAPPDAESGSWIETLVPAVALGVLLVVGFTYREQFSGDGLSLLAIVGAVFTVFIGLRATAGYQHERRMIADMHAQNQELMLAQKMQALGTLSSGIAHDFNNLLTGMMTGLDMLRRRVDVDDRTEGYMSMMEQSMNRAADLTRRLRSLSRRERPSMGVCRPNGVVHYVAELGRRGLASAVEIVEHRRCPDIVIRGDEAMIEQSLLNLVINATHALQSGGRIDIGVELRELGRGERVCFWVQDNGPGIDEAIQERIFEPFFTTKSATEGTGLGLAMVYAVARAHGGDVRLDSEIGKGTIVEIEIPAIEMMPNVHGASNASYELVATGETALVVDDRDEPLFAAKAILEAHGFRVIAAWSGAEALSKLAAAPTGVQIVLTDAMMPGMTGQQLLVKLREAQYGGPVVLMSGHSEQLHGAEGFDAVLSKPFRPADLTEAVYAALHPDALDVS